MSAAKTEAQARALERERASDCGSVATGVVLGILLVFVAAAFSATPMVAPRRGGLAARHAHVANNPNVDCMLDKCKDPRPVRSAILKGQLHDLTIAEPAHCASGVSESTKRKQADAALEWLRTHPRAVVLYWAHWCGHCAVALPVFAKAVAETGVEAAIVNASMVTDDVLERARVRHFPFLVAGSDVFEKQMTHENVVDFLRAHA